MSGADRERILLAVGKSANRQVLADHLSVRWTVVPAPVASELDQPFDLAVFDRRALEQLAQRLGRYREQQFPRFVPVLLLLSPGEVEPRTPALVDLFDEVLRGPVERALLDRRVGTLLRIRMLSRELERRRQDIEAVSREKDELLGMAAHDLRNPLTALWMGARMLKTAQLDVAERQQCVDAILDSAERMLILLEEILDVEQIEQGCIALERQSQPLGPIVVAAVDALALPAREKRIALTVDDRAPGITAIVDARRIDEILTNLLSNALKYSHSETTVKVTLAASGNRWAEVAVADQGVGIDAEDYDKLFRKFSRFSQPTAGEPSAGLGLAIVKKLVELHDGQVDFSSTPGRGTTFTIRLPR